jgi:hypothetical protein
MPLSPEKQSAVRSLLDATRSYRLDCQRPAENLGLRAECEDERGVSLSKGKVREREKSAPRYPLWVRLQSASVP